MTSTEFAGFKYEHGDAASRSTARRWFTGISLALALLIIATRIIAFPVGLFTLLVPVIAWYSVSRQLLLGPRYLLCGNTIIYYANVKRVTFSRTAGTLLVQSNSGNSLSLQREKFPTNARKADKIAKNKAAKFDKVADKLIEKVRKAAPGANLIGV